MQAYICDRESCRKQMPPRKDFPQLPPVGWYTLRGYSSRSFPEHQFCSVDCLANHVQALVLAELPSVPPPPAPEFAHVEAWDADSPDTAPREAL